MAPSSRPFPAARPVATAPAVGFTGKECLDTHEPALSPLTRVVLPVMTLLSAPFVAPLVWMGSSGRRQYISTAGDELSLYGL